MCGHDEIEQALLEEWERPLPELVEQSESAARSALRYGWHLSDEIDQIAQTFAAADLPHRFHRTAAEIYQRFPRTLEPDDGVEQVLSALTRRAARADLPRGPR